MMFVINHDSGRLSEAPELAGVFDLIALERYREVEHWAAELAQDEPYILFLHCHADVAVIRLAELRALDAGDGWPVMLRGIVIFDSSANAGQKDADNAAALLAQNGFDPSLVQIMGHALPEGPSTAAVTAVQLFVGAIRKGDSFESAARWLYPEGAVAAFRSVWMLARLIRSSPMLTDELSMHDYLAANLDLPQLSMIARTFGLQLLKIDQDSLDRLARAIRRAHPNWSDDLLCPGCRPRYRAWHALAGGANIRDKRIDHARAAYLGSPEALDSMAAAIAQEIPVPDQRLLTPHIRTELLALLFPGCHFLSEKAYRTAMVIDSLRASDGDPVAIANEMLPLFRCDAETRLLNSARMDDLQRQGKAP